MQLSPEERHKIFEEEKARIDTEQKQWMTTGGSTTGLRPNIADYFDYTLPASEKTDIYQNRRLPRRPGTRNRMVVVANVTKKIGVV